MSELNRIYVDSSLTINGGYSNTICFSDGKAIEKSRYTLENNELSLYKETQEYVSVFFNANMSFTYYFEKILNDYGVVVWGKDKHGNKLTNVKSENLLVFVDGILIERTQYEVLDSESIALLIKTDDLKLHSIIIYVSNETLETGVLTDPMNIQYQDRTSEPTYPNNPDNAIEYSKDNTLIFRNGEYISPDKIETINGYTFINFIPTRGDTFKYYKLGNNTQSLNFSSIKGITTYGPLDDYNVSVPNLYDSTVEFDDITKIIVDDMRPGFIICEVDRPGRLLVVDTNYETNKLKTLTIQPFSSKTYKSSDYYFEVPEAKSIVDYLSDYDKKFTMLPEILRIFQRFLLDEIHDEVERIKNIRNIHRVNSEHIYKLIKLLGMDLDIKHLNIKQMQDALDELTEFYRIAGTKNSINYFNVIQDNTRIVDIQPLFTFHSSNSEKKQDKVYSYTYSLYKNGAITYGGTGYKVGEKYKILNEAGQETDIVITVREVDEETGAILDGGFTANMPEGRIAYSEVSLPLTPNAAGAVLSCSSFPERYRYNGTVTSTGTGGFDVGDVLVTPLYDGEVVVDSVDADHNITAAHITKTEGNISYDNFVNVPLIPKQSDTNLKLLVQAKTLDTEVIYADYGRPEEDNYTPGAKADYTVVDTALYKITFSGAGGSGAVSDTSLYSYADGKAENGYSGEKCEVIVACEAGTKIEYILGQGGQSNTAFANDQIYRNGDGGIGPEQDYEIDSNGARGIGDKITLPPAQRSGYECYEYNGIHHHIRYIGSSYNLNRYASLHYYNNLNKNPLKVGETIYSAAASGAGGGGSILFYGGKTWRAKGGNGGTATLMKNNHFNADRKYYGGTGGYGGTYNGTGAEGGKVPTGEGNYTSTAGENGYIIIEKIIQDYTYDTVLQNNYNIDFGVGTILKTTDDDRTFSVTVNAIDRNIITDWTLSPESGEKPIYTLDEDGNIASYSAVFDLFNSSKTAFLTIDQDIINYRYGLKIDKSGGKYMVGQKLTDPQNMFEITTTKVVDGNIIGFTFEPESGPNNINTTDVPLTTLGGEGARIVISSTADVNIQNIEREYVDFYTPEEQGAVWKHEYRIPMVDYGSVSEGSPNSPTPWKPGEPDIDYGLTSMGTPNSPETENPGNPDIDYGLVSEKIKGKWVEWLEWDRPKNLYPTNHVEIQLNVLSGNNYEQLINRFYKQFYSLASTVLYIHRLVTIFSFGNTSVSSITENEQYPQDGMIMAGFMTTQPYVEEIHTITCDPSIQGGNV